MAEHENIEDLEVNSRATPSRRCGAKAGKIVLAVFSVVAVVACALAVFFILYQRRTSFDFVYINDVHIDLEYNEFSDIVNDPEGKCRRAYNGTVKPFKFGQYGCDTPNVTFLSALQFMGKTVKNPQFVIYGGDSVGHGLGLSREGVKAVFESIVDGLHEQYPNVPILVTMGNNDFVPNYGTKETDHLDYASIGDVMKKYMNEVQVASFLKGGYYYHDVPSTKMRLLLLNTVIYNTYRDVEEDPVGQFAWIREACEEARKLGYSIGSAMHIFPGVSHWSMTQGWHDVYARRFDALVKEFDIKFTLVGHCHYDMIMPLYGSEGTSMGYSLSSPSISPAHQNNPGFRVLTYRDGDIKDIHQWYADIMMNPDELTWKTLYRFSEAYKVPDVTKDSLLKVIKWVSETSEGMWRYREKVTAMAMDHGSFYYCLLKATTAEQVKNCMKGLASIRALSPYDDTL